MIKYEFKIPIYNVNVTLIQVDNPKDANSIKRLLNKYNAKDGVDDVVQAIEDDCIDGGDTFRNLRKRKIIVIFYKMTTDEVREEIYGHEKRHIEDRVLEFFSVNDVESAGLLAGFLSTQFYKFKQLLNK